MMKLTVVGKYGPYAKAGNSACSCYLVEDGGRYLVMDMGAGSLSRLLSVVDVSKVTDIFLSHLHFDHTSDLLPFRYLLEERGQHVNIYVHRDSSPWCELLLNHPLFNVVDIDASSVINVGDMTLRFFLMNHTVDNYAVRISGSRTLVYTGDTRYTDALLTALSGADCAVVDCSKERGTGAPHMSVDIGIDLQKKTGVRIIASHVGADYEPYEEFAKVDGMELAVEGKTYVI